MTDHEWADIIHVLEFRIDRMKKEIDKLERQIDSFAMLTLWGRIKFMITRKFP